MTKVSSATSFLALSLCAVVAASCGDPFQVTAPYSTATDSFAIRALTGTPITAQTVWRIANLSRYRLDSLGSQFDVAFDITSAGKVVVYPARTVSSPPPSSVVTPPSVGLQVSTSAYAAIDRAPPTGYVADTALVISVGQPVLVRTASDWCSTQVTGGTQMYAKFIVDSINTSTRSLYIRSTLQPSCNFRSLAPGVPTF